MHAPTLSPEKSQDKEMSDDIINKLGNKDKNHVDQPTDIVNIEELDSDDIPIGKRLAPGISKRLNSWKGQVVGSSSTPSKYVRKKANVGPTIRWSNVVTPTPKKKYLKRKEVPSESSEYDQDALSEEEGGEKADGSDEEEDNKDIIVTSDEEETRSDEDQC
ncbi:hypothetical protein KIW84_073401 [Lathyrus oleraceus]|uniref:Uncharacterized protein n=1 Tax=Pisum sativum TaxID=3888 RepID=A0A9D4VPY4_PEA|nr:hypothetical protein KIW84_073401 [Pisum sativum]